MNGSGLCIKTGENISEKHISDMTWREKKNHIIDKIYVNPKNKDNVSGSQITEETKLNKLKASPTMDQVIKI